MDELDSPLWWALHGRQRPFGRFLGRACRFDPAVGPFAAVDPEAVAAGGDELAAAFEDLAALLGPGGAAVLLLDVEAPVALGTELPDGWGVDFHAPGVQLVGEELAVAIDPEAVPLGPPDVADMLELVGKAQPGPFAERTVELGGYVGRREGGRLVAMAGERMAPGGWVELSAVATDPGRQGRGLATGLVRHVGASVRARGAQPFLHTGAANTRAIALYRHLGFRHRRSLNFARVRAPG